MKYSAIPLTLVLAATALAQAPSDIMPSGDDYRFQKFNSTVTQLHNYYFQPPAWNADGIFVHRGDTEHADVFEIGAGIIFDHSNKRVDIDFPAIESGLALGTASLEDASAFATASHTHPQSDITNLVSDLAGKEPLLTAGTSAQYYRGDKTWATFPTNLSAFTNGPGYITGVTSGMVTTALGYTPYNGATNPNSYITQSGARSAISLTTTGTTGAATYNSSTGALNIPQYTASRSFSSASRSLNTSFQLSTTRDAFVSYSVDIAATATLVGGQTGTVYLEYADDSGITTNVVEVARFVNGNSVSLAIAITVNQNVTGTLTGFIPAGKYCRIRTQNNVGTPSHTYRSGQEVLS